MLKKFLEEVMVLVAGKQAEKIADLLDDKKYLNEFLIAKKMDITINQTRNILYKISDFGLVSFTRKKDKKKGWYTYFWKIENLKSLEFLKKIILKRIDQLEHQIKSRESKRFYSCERCNVEFSEENALLHNFTCNECGGIFTMKDNTKNVKDMKRTVDKFNSKLELIGIEIDIEEKKLEKKKVKQMKKQEKENEEKKKIAREARKALKEKSGKSTTTKKAKTSTKKETKSPKKVSFKKSASVKSSSKTKSTKKNKK